MIREQPHYRRGAFVAGATAAGFSVVGALPAAGAGDVLVVWNRYGHFHAAASAVERSGGAVAVVENGYIGKDTDGGQLYAIHRSMLHGYGTWADGGMERWEALGVKLQPWRIGGRRIVILAQRGIGVPPIASSASAAEALAARLRSITKLPVHVRHHPGRNPPTTSLAEDLWDAAFAVTHTSSAGLHALAAGVPVITTADRWFGRPGAAFLEAGASDDAWGRWEGLLVRDDAARAETFRRVAWAQWTINEIRDGTPFRYLFT